MVGERTKVWEYGQSEHSHREAFGSRTDQARQMEEG